MKVEDLFTAESIEEFRRLTEDAAEAGHALMEQYRTDRNAELAVLSENTNAGMVTSSDLKSWIAVFEDGGLAGAASPGLWSGLIEQGFIICRTETCPYPDNGVFEVEMISPKVFDGYRRDKQLTSQYAFTKVQVCLRRRNEVPKDVQIPAGWRGVALVDTELFELPPDVASDNFDDREKIHVIYLAGQENGHFVCQPIYIGIGTGEAYGVGTRSRSTTGRSRFYRYDIQDNFHLEYIRYTAGARFEVEDAKSLPDCTKIGEASATLLLGAEADYGGMMCLSDPNIAEGYAEWIHLHPENHLVFQEVTLEKVRVDLRKEKAGTPFPPEDVLAVLDFACRIHRLFFVAWQHPLRLSEKEGLDLYFPGLPAFRRREYEIYRFHPELFDIGPHNSESDALTIPKVLWSDDLRGRLESKQPGAARFLEKWLQRQVVEDLYAYGNHPEVRLCAAMALWARLSGSGLWGTAVEATYRSRLFEVRFSPEQLRRDPGDRV